MKSININAYAKLNLTLDVIKKRPDGFHELETVFQLVSLYDELKITVSPGHGIIINSNNKFIPNGETNLAYQAVKLFSRFSNLENYTIKIDLQKKIPICAGLGGGSADAAAVLRGLYQLFNCSFDFSLLINESVKIGADVPFCLIGGTAVGKGKGEILTPLRSICHPYYIIVKPSFSVSTSELFNRWDYSYSRLHPDTTGFISYLQEGNLLECGHRLYNVFEETLPRGKDVIQQIKNALIENGAIGASMTGTGSAVFGMFRTFEDASQALPIIKKDYFCSFVAEPVSFDFRG